MGHDNRNSGARDFANELCPCFPCFRSCVLPMGLLDPVFK